MTSNNSKTFAHMVYFTLKESSAAAQETLVESCKKYLNDHEGLQHFSVGSRAEAYQRPVNNTDFHVALHLVFATEADHDRYQNSERHQRFINENKESWAQVQVFDALA
ncbi:MAG: Dabb family protein [Planctomycetes bacterium]|nr:Dabb family protein [Planctomycetota bacterium]